MTDIRAFTRDLAAQMEADLGRPDWVAVDHWKHPAAMLPALARKAIAARQHAGIPGARPGS